MGFANTYLNRQQSFYPYFSDSPLPGLRLAIVIPALAEEKLLRVLQSIDKARRGSFGVEVLVVINAPENAGIDVINKNLASFKEAEEFALAHSDQQLQFKVMHISGMPVRVAGVGLARKTGMDEALFRLNLLNRPDAFLVSLDADCEVEGSYLTALEEAILSHPHAPGFNIYFEHPLEGTEFSSAQYRAVAAYELHLRYMNVSLKLAGFPFAFHAVGSGFGVRASAYAMQGGMNRRKAGEDFYFLNKIIPLGGFYEVNNTCVIPSARLSGRVPFGTGAAMTRILENGFNCVQTYNPDSYTWLGQFFNLVPSFFRSEPSKVAEMACSLPEPISGYLNACDLTHHVAEINANSAGLAAFAKRFYMWFNAFRIMKCLNHLRANCHPALPVHLAVDAMLKRNGFRSIPNPTDVVSQLRYLRNFERNG